MCIVFILSHLKVYNSTSRRALTRLCTPQLYLHSELFHHPQHRLRNQTMLLFFSTLLDLPPLWGIFTLLSVSAELPLLGNTCKWTHSYLSFGACLALPSIIFSESVAFTTIVFFLCLNRAIVCICNILLIHMVVHTLAAFRSL